MLEKIPDAFVFMKVGTHAGESLADILVRKRREYEVAGRVFWGYGGTTLHPIRIVQPFARIHAGQQGGIYIVMQPMNSHANPDILPASEYSVDGSNWQPLPSGVLVTGSRYAVILDEIQPGDLDFYPEEFSVGYGPSEGTRAVDYLTGRIDKGCLVRAAASPTRVASPARKIGLVAKLKEPYGVMVRP